MKSFLKYLTVFGVLAAAVMFLGACSKSSSDLPETLGDTSVGYGTGWYNKSEYPDNDKAQKESNHKEKNKDRLIQLSNTLDYDYNNYLEAKEDFSTREDLKYLARRYSSMHFTMTVAEKSLDDDADKKELISDFYEKLKEIKDTYEDFEAQY